MKIENKFLQLSIDETDGSFISFTNWKKEFILSNEKNRPVFTIRLRDDEGKPVDLSASDAARVRMEVKPDTGRRMPNGTETITEISFESLGGSDIDAFMRITVKEDDPLTYWNLSIANNSGLRIEWIHFPEVVVADDLVGKGGDSRILWPAVEGVVIEDSGDRENSMWFKYGPSVYPSKGWEGMYPGPVSTQFMAYYGENGGLYFGAHDSRCNVKTIEFYRHEEGIRLEFKLFPGGPGKGIYKMDFDMVIGVFFGDWHDAADIYREWYEGNMADKPLKLGDNTLIPEWMEDSPVVVSYPVRGEKDHGDMKINDEYFPFVNAVPCLKRLSKELDSRVMALLMHWEGTAPWAPPYVWPPLGGEEGFRSFVDSMHGDGNLIGVYCSGIGWTQESTIIREYECKKEFEEQNLRDVMCESPEGGLPYSNICAGAIRWGYDMCPANAKVRDIAIGEAVKIAEAGVDYLQFFDQNLGGAPYACYSRKHGHPPAPGRWRNDAMAELMDGMQDAVNRFGRKVAVGCETGAAEPFIPHLLFNELRYCIAFDLGRPVPLYQYLYHEYVNNFMGNQISSCMAINIEKSPDNILMRLAMAFIMGEMFTLVLRDKGMISWDWDTDWSIPAPDQEKVKNLVRNMNAWRKFNGKPFLRYGKMHKPYEIKYAGKKEFEYHDGRKLMVPCVLTSRWTSPDGREAQVMVNYTECIREVALVLRGCTGKKTAIYDDARKVPVLRNKPDNDDMVVSIGPLSAVMVEVI